MGAKYTTIKGKEELLDGDLVNKSIDDIVRAITSNLSKYNSLPQKVIIYQNNPKEGNDNETEEKKAECVECYNSKYTLDDIYLADKSRK